MSITTTRTDEANAIRLGRAADKAQLIDAISRHPAPQLDNEDWRDLWDRHVAAGGTRPEYKIDDEQDEGEGQRWVNRTITALGREYLESNTSSFGRTSEGYGWHDSSEYGVCDGGNRGGDRCVAGLVLAAGDDLNPTVPEPDIDDIDTAGKPSERDLIHILVSNAIVEASIDTHRHPASDYREPRRDDRDAEDEFPVAYTVSRMPAIDAEVYTSLDKARDALAKLTDDGELYDDDDAARTALAEACAKQLTAPEGMEIAQEDGDPDGPLALTCPDSAESYHLGDAEMTACLRAGSFAPVMDAVAEAMGRRAVLAAMRERNESVDEWLVSHPVFVGIPDSLTAGNCPQGTRAFADIVAEQLHVDSPAIGGIRSDVMLSHRDDVYTRRAARMAALRVMSR